MPHKPKTTTTLLIVESPAKCKKIEDYLGPGYKCIASYGHIRDLPSLKNIDIDNNFALNYQLIENPIKLKNIEYMRKAIKHADDIMLSSDSDREGEMISYSIMETFKLPANTKRITFNEITETALREAIENPRKIDMNLVHAQQARQVLDLLVGFKISPILWKLISGPKKDYALSAGRCQTPALKLVYENQKEINEAQEKQIYNVTGYFTNSNLPFDLNSDDKFDNDVSVIDFLDKSADFSHIYTCSQPTKVYKQPPVPFTTSRIQQVSSNELHYSPKETMRICQQLYEKGYITYMRTDSKVYSDEFKELAREYIERIYGANYIATNDTGKKEKKTKKSNKSNKKSFAQEAHEAIRPTNISLQLLPEETDVREKKMYKLIWTNTMESLMAPASANSITANITAPLNLKYSYSTEIIDFPGWKIVENKFSRENKDYLYLQMIKKNTPIAYKKICAKSTIKGTKSHYTEAKLVQLLEEKGIGRPSTFSSLIDKIQERGYVKKEDIKGKELLCKDYELENGEICEIEVKREFGNEKGKLVIQPLGVIVMELLDKHFNKIFNYDYTSNMEDSLDRVAKGELTWTDICSACNIELNELIECVRDETKFEVQLDENNTYIMGKYGPIIKCIEEKDGKEEVSFKSVKKDADVSKIVAGECELSDIVEKNVSNSQFNLGQYDGKELTLKKGKYGLYVMWGSESKTLKELGNRPIENVTFEEVKAILDKGSSTIREINKNVSIRKGSKGDYVFHKDAKMKKPAFYDIKGFSGETSEDYKTCDIAILKSWLAEKYSVKF